MSCRPIRVHMFEFPDLGGGTVFVRASSKEAAISLVAEQMFFFSSIGFDEKGGKAFLETITSGWKREVDLQAPGEKMILRNHGCDLGDEFNILALTKEGAEKDEYPPDTVTQFYLMPSTVVNKATGLVTPVSPSIEGWTTPCLGTDQYVAMFYTE